MYKIVIKFLPNSNKTAIVKTAREFLDAINYATSSH